MSEKCLVYVFDPLCGWCYGFSPVVRRLYETTRRRASWEVLAGGMVVGERVGPIGRIAGFLRQALPRVEGTTGIRFGEAFTTGVLEPGTLVLSSLEPSRALQTAKILAPDRSLDFAQALQRGLYEQGLDVTDFGVLSQIAEDQGIEGFDIEYLKVTSYDATLEEFRRVSGMGITGFPTLVGLGGDGTRIFSRGWAPYDRLAESVDRWLDS